MIEKRKIDFYRRHVQHYGLKIAESAQSDSLILALINGDDLSKLFTALKEVIDVDWSTSEK